MILLVIDNNPLFRWNVQSLLLKLFRQHFKRKTILCSTPNTKQDSILQAINYSVIAYINTTKNTSYQTINIQNHNRFRFIVNTPPNIVKKQCS